MKFACSLLLLLVAAGVAVSAAKPAQTFADWLSYHGEGKSSKAGASSVEPSYDYEETELLDACLRAVTICDDKQDPPTEEDHKLYVKHTTYGVACCNNKHYNKEMNSFLSHPDEAGEVEFTIFPRQGDLIHDGDVTMKGTFIAQAYLHEKAADCGHPFCDKMVLTITGKYYQVLHAVIRTKPNENELPESKGCKPPTSYTPVTNGKKAAATVPVQAQSYNEEPVWYEVPSATVFMGTVTVNSRLHSTKFSDAWFEFVSNYDRSELNKIVEVPAHEAEDKYCLDPYLMKLTFIKNKAY